MESKANYALIGTFVIIAVMSMLAFVAYISGQQFDEKYNEYLVVYTSPPRGITVGSEVRYNELKMGEVIDTKLDPLDDSRVLVHIRIKASTPIYKDTYGQNEPLGLTGLSYIQLSKGPSNQPIEEPGFREIARIEGRESQFETILGRSDSIINNVNIALLRASNVLSPEATENFHNILASVDTISAAVANSNLTSARINQFMDAIEKAAIDVSTASVAVDVTGKDISKFIAAVDIDDVLLQTRSTLRTAEITAAEFTKFANRGSLLMDESILLVEQLSTTGLQDLATSMADLKTLMESLNRVAADLERSPIAFVTGQKKEIMELPQ